MLFLLGGNFLWGGVSKEEKHVISLHLIALRARAICECKITTLSSLKESSIQLGIIWDMVSTFFQGILNMFPATSSPHHVYYVYIPAGSPQQWISTLPALFGWSLKVGDRNCCFITRVLVWECKTARVKLRIYISKDHRREFDIENLDFVASSMRFRKKWNQKLSPKWWFDGDLPW